MTRIMIRYRVQLSNRSINVKEYEEGVDDGNTCETMRMRLNYRHWKGDPPKLKISEGNIHLSSEASDK